MKSKEKIDKELCGKCDFGDKGNKIEGKSVCINKMFDRRCKFDK